ncbi:hypothetical protein M3202_07310 [Alkalihalobacillus oceani]|uniref:Uncharacterized protein n=1 Tax=Halalkalibacter oceani TaxID=1653776 RepID=A0A9X2DN15_9BACI|nr:hypothetical protein [Halalkalibacter oceani]MCM3713889.1 hypothetical protein [Halalkalibacter oceani]
MFPFLFRHLYIFYSAILILYVGNTFISSSLVDYVIGVLAIPMLLLSFKGASRLFRTLGCIFLSIGMLFYFYSGLPILDLPLYMTSTMQLLAFLTVLPWMNSVVHAGRFDRRMNEVMKANVSSLGKLYVRSSFTTYMLCTFVNLSSIPLTQEVLLENLAKAKKKLRDTFISQTTLRGFSLALAWSPMEIIVALTVDATGVSYMTYLPWLIICSVTVLLADWLWGRKKYQSISYEPSGTGAARSLQPRRLVGQIVKLFLALSVFLVAVVTIGNVFQLNFILSVTLVILPFSFIWSILLKRWNSFITIGWRTWKVRTNHMQNFVVLFLSLAFFSSALNETPFLHYIQQPFFAASEYPLLILILIQLTYLVLSMIGVHPIATIGILVEVLQPLYDIMNPLSIGMVLITGALPTAAVGVYGVTVTMTSMITKQNPYRVTWANLPFALVYGGMGVLLGYLLL